MLEISLRQNRFKDRDRKVPIRLKLDLGGDNGTMVCIEVARSRLPSNVKLFPLWNTAITGALALCIANPPRFRGTERGKQFIIDLKKNPASWVSPRIKTVINKLRRWTLKVDWRKEAETHDLVLARTFEEQAKALFAAEVIALHTRLPVKVKVQCQNYIINILPEDLLPTLVNFSTRLYFLLAMAAGWYGKKRPRGRPSQNLALTFWVGMVAAVAHHIVVQEMRTQRGPSPDLGKILNEVSDLEGFKCLQDGQDKRRGFIAYIVARAFQGAKDMDQLSSFAPLVAKNPDFSNVDAFDATYVQPYTRKLKSYLPQFTKALRRRLLDILGSLAHELGL